MKNSKTTEEQNKATAPKDAKAKGATNEDVTSAKDAKKISTTKRSGTKHEKP